MLLIASLVVWQIINQQPAAKKQKLMFYCHLTCLFCFWVLPCWRFSFPQTSSASRVFLCVFLGRVPRRVRSLLCPSFSLTRNHAASLLRCCMPPPPLARFIRVGLLCVVRVKRVRATAIRPVTRVQSCPLALLLSEFFFTCTSREQSALTGMRTWRRALLAGRARAQGLRRSAAEAPRTLARGGRAWRRRRSTDGLVVQGTRLLLIKPMLLSTTARRICSMIACATTPPSTSAFPHAAGRSAAAAAAAAAAAPEWRSRRCWVCAPATPEGPPAIPAEEREVGRRRL